MEVIRMLKAVTPASGNPYATGHEYEVSNATAKEYIALGWAVSADPKDIALGYLRDMNAGVFVSPLSDSALAEAAQKAGIPVADATDEELPVFQAMADKKMQEAADAESQKALDEKAEQQRQEQDVKESKERAAKRDIGNPFTNGIEGEPVPSEK